MTESSPQPASPSAQPSPGAPAPNTWKRPLVAALLSLLVPGLGQLYNRQLWKAILIALIGPVVYFCGALAGAFRSFFPMIVLITCALLWQVGSACEAFWTARKHCLSQMPDPLSVLKWITATLLILIPPFFASGDTFHNRIAHFRAYRVPSASNCPTVCEGERMIVDPSAYSSRMPQRGDLVMFKRPLFDSLLFKRVLGLPGDVVTQSDGGILVNGKPAALVDLTQVCGSPPDRDRSYLPVTPKSVTVPTDSLYVVGDNWSNSMDSRMEQFGFVPLQNVRGRPMFLYWSPYKNRIGCRLR